MTITTQTDGFTRIAVAGLTIVVPTTDDSMADDRAEIRCGDSRVFVESHVDGLLIGAPEKFATAP